ncbi:MAG TPA: DUF2924 domain-containing protein, partial [Candidatus Acidoferrales bacterium]|nr:DUF2924 domain-containing protein [Candidatus Acidoferrales bacterium]
RARDERLPAVGTVLKRMYRGQTIEVEVLEDGFKFQSSRYRSLSAIAREVSGTRWNLDYAHDRRFRALIHSCDTGGD